MSEQQWRGWDEEQMNADANAVQGDDGFFKMVAREQPYYVRILPASPNDPSPLLVTQQHYFEFPDKSKFVFNCPKLMARCTCDGCITIDRMLDSGHANDEKLAKRFMPKTRVFVRLIDRENEHLGPRIFGFGKLIFDELKLLRKNPQRGGDFTDPTERGYDLELHASGDGMERRYKVYPTARGPLASPEQVREWMAALPSMDRYGKILEREAIIAGLRLDRVAPPPSTQRHTPQQPPRALNQTGARTLDAAPTPVRPSARPAGNGEPPIF